MKRFSTLAVMGFGALGLVFASKWPADAATGAQLLAHRAVYDLELGAADGAGAPAAARGRIVYEFTGSACEGYATNYRQITEITPSDEDPRLSDLRSSTFEDGDGKTFRFSSKTSVDGKPLEPLDGSATRSNDGALSVNISLPKKTRFDIGGDVAFPTVQIMDIIDAAQRGEKTVALKVFDGTDADGKVYDTLTVIGQPSSAPLAGKSIEGAEALASVRHWPVSISYFDQNKKDNTPIYILAFDLFENGVSGNLRLDYGNYALNGHMTKFETISQKPCR
jgi:hypothetical protein